MATYNYTKTPVDIDRLSTEIDSSSISSASYLYANFTSPSLAIIFDGDLSGTDKTTLDTIVSNHTGQPIFLQEGLVAVADGQGSINFVSVVNPDVVTTSGITTHFNLDGGRADSVYGGTTAIDGGNASTTF